MDSINLFLSKENVSEEFNNALQCVVSDVKTLDVLDFWTGLNRAYRDFIDDIIQENIEDNVSSNFNPILKLIFGKKCLKQTHNIIMDINTVERFNSLLQHDYKGAIWDGVFMPDRDLVFNGHCCGILEFKGGGDKKGLIHSVHQAAVYAASILCEYEEKNIEIEFMPLLEYFAQN